MTEGRKKARGHRSAKVNDTWLAGVRDVGRVVYRPRLWYIWVGSGMSGVTECEGGFTKRGDSKVDGGCTEVVRTDEVG